MQFHSFSSSIANPCFCSICSTIFVLVRLTPWNLIGNLDVPHSIQPAYSLYSMPGYVDACHPSHALLFVVTTPPWVDRICISWIVTMRIGCTYGNACCHFHIHSLVSCHIHLFPLLAYFPITFFFKFLPNAVVTTVCFVSFHQSSSCFPLIPYPFMLPSTMKHLIVSRCLLGCHSIVSMLSPGTLLQTLDIDRIPNGYIVHCRLPIILC